MKQLEEAERNGQDALFALETVEMELAQKIATMNSTFSRLSETLPPYKFEQMCEFAFGEGKKEWEQVWKREWVEGGTKRTKFTQLRVPSKRQLRSSPPYPPPVYHPRSSPLPPSSPPPPTSPNLEGHLPPQTGPPPINGVPVDGFQSPARPRDRSKATRGFTRNPGSARYQRTSPEPAAGPSQMQPSRRLKRDLRRLEVDEKGTLVLVDTTEEIEEQRRQIKKSMEQQAQKKIYAQV